MNPKRWARMVLPLSLAVLPACDSGRSPSSPSTPASFLAGTWSGTLTIQRQGQPDTSAATTWTFEVVPQTNSQSFRATIQSQHPWLPITTAGTTAIAPAATPPTQISTQGNYPSPRGCQGTFGSLGTAENARIDATFHGVDCNGETFDGRVVLTK